MRDRAQHERLQAAAGRAASRQLQEVLQGGIGFHHAAMEAQDRALVEACFLDRSILVRLARSPATVHALLNTMIDFLTAPSWCACAVSHDIASSSTHHDRGPVWHCTIISF